MSKVWFPYLLLLVILTGACAHSGPIASLSAPPATETKKADTASVTINPTATTSPTPTPYPPTIIPQPTLSPTPEGLTEHCFATRPSLADTVIPSGILVVGSSEGMTQISFTTHTLKNSTKGKDLVETSPDGKWLLYKSSNNPFIMFESMVGEKPFHITEEDSWDIGTRVRWLDNQRIWFPTYSSLGYYILPVVVLNPFNGRRVTIKTDYPGIMPLQYQSVRGFEHFGYSSAVYDPSLNLVIYPEFDPVEGFLQTLWDRTTQKKLARISSDSWYDNLPIWWDSQKQFLVVGHPDKNSKFKEWFAISTNGQVKQLSNFEITGQEYDITNYASLSPDEKTLAFALAMLKDKNGYFLPGNLVLLNLETMQAIDTCIPLSGNQPIWSLDGRYLAISTPLQQDNNYHNQLMLVGITEKKSYLLLEGSSVYPGGWLIQP
jgi:hypothetical protein